MPRGRMSAPKDIDKLINDADYNDIGGQTTKHEYHAAAREAGAKSFHAVAYDTPFKHSKTLANNKQILIDVNHFIRQEFGCKTIREITPQMVGAYLQHKIDGGAKSSTFFRCTAPAMNNLESMLNRVGVAADFQSVIKDAKAIAAEKCEKPDMSSRNYGDNAERVIEAIKDDTARFCCHLQLEYGLRANESYKIHLIPGRENVMEIHQKGGARTIKEISPEDYQRLVSMSNGRDNFYISDYQTVRRAWGDACERMGVADNGLHGLRATYAHRSFDAHEARGLSRNEAKAEVSQELGHTRLEIVDTYLR
jgi:integrase